MAVEEKAKNIINVKSDEDLAKNASSNQEAFLELMKRYEKKLMSYIRRISNSSMEETEDILQEVFIKVFRNLNDFDSNLKFSSWVYRITHNQVISDHRKKQARPQNITLDLEDDIILNIKSETNIVREIDRVLLREKIDVVLNSMDKKYKDVLILKFFEQKDYKEISDILKKPMGTVATLINRAKKQFKKEMEEISLL